MEGKITLPIIILLEKVSKNNRLKLKRIFMKKTRNQKDLNFTMSQLESFGIKEYCIEYAQKFQKKSEIILNGFNNKQSKLLKELIVSSIERQN